MKSKLICLTIFTLLFCWSANAQSGRKTVPPNAPETRNEEKREADETKEEKRGDVQPVKIISRPKPDESVVAGCFRNENFSYVKVVLQVTFETSGKIGDVTVKTPSGCQDFDDESVEAARRIKFEPATQNGEPIRVAKTVVYAGGIR